MDYSLSILANIKININFIKPGILTISYGSTHKGISDQLIIDYFRQDDLVKGNKVTFTLISKKFNKQRIFILIINNY